MARHIDGQLYYERMGRAGPVMAFVHPNPMDQSAWMFQMAHFSTWFRCIAIDIPGYGRSPKALAGLTVDDMAEAAWEAIDAEFPGEESAVLVGCSAGATIVPYMHHRYPARTRAIVICGVGYWPDKGFIKRPVDNYTANGIGYRWAFTFEDLSPAFRSNPLAHYFAELFSERNTSADLQSILHQYEAIKEPYPDRHFERVACPTLILSGTEDSAHDKAFALKTRIPDCELKVLPGAGHACQIEQPWLFDRFMIDFLSRRGILRHNPPLATAR